MNGFRGKLLAGPALSQDQDGRIGAGELEGLLAHKHPSVEAVAAFNHQVESWPEGNPEAQERHRTMLEKAGLGHRTDIVTMADRLDLDDGRDVPHGGHLGKGLAKH
jgi:hypothetical protein